jgi:hypothetical protein
MLSQILASIVALALAGCATHAPVGSARPSTARVNDWDRRIFTLSIFANLETGQHGSRAQLERDFSGRLSTALNNFEPELGQWDVVWGPTIYQAPGSTLGDNAMYVVRQRKPGSSRDEYVVAIAAVNSKSFYDWFTEQLNITPQVAWRALQGTSNDPRISKGAEVGLKHLLDLHSGKRLVGFLAKDIDRNARITVTGHSYGGVVAPLLALWLSERKATWDPSGRCELACLMSAAATPGNAAFVDYYLKSGLGSRSTRIDNSLDLAWRAFNAKDMEAIPSLYAPQLKPSKFLELALAQIAAESTAAGGYAQIKAARQITIKGEFAPRQSPASDLSDIRFLKQVQYQHIPAYFSGLGLTKLRRAYEDQSAQGLGILPGPKDTKAFQEKLRHP